MYRLNIWISILIRFSKCSPMKRIRFENEWSVRLSKLSFINVKYGSMHTKFSCMYKSHEVCWSYDLMYSISWKPHYFEVKNLWIFWMSYPSVRNHGILAKIHGKVLGSLAKILPWSCHDLGKDAMAMQDRAKANHHLGKDAMINHVLAKGSMVANPFFWEFSVFETMVSLQNSCFRSLL